MNENRHNRQPADLLPGEQALATFYGGDHGEQPPRHLDDSILAAARRAAGAGPQRRRREWLLPTALAASILLTTGIMLYLEYRPVLEDVPAIEVASVAADAGAGLVAPEETGMPAQRDRNAPARRLAEAAPAREGDAALTLPAKSVVFSMTRERRAAAPRAPAPAAAPLAPASIPATSTLPGYRSSPREWLVQVETLIRNGQLHEARRELDELLRRYPDFQSADLTAAKKRLVNVAPSQ